MGEGEKREEEVMNTQGDTTYSTNDPLVLVAKKEHRRNIQ